MSNISYVSAAENIAPTECRVSINDNAKYTNNRFVTLELYGVDESAMQVWISNDGDIGTVLDFEYNKTYSITDVNYAVGTELTSSNSTTTTNSDNVLRIENWPLSSINGSKKVYVVFRDAYGNITPITGLSTIDITYYMNDNSDIAYKRVQTVKNLGVYTPSTTGSSGAYFFKGWSESPTATIPNYGPETIVAFDSSTNLYAVYSTLNPGDYVYYPVDLTKSYSADGSSTGVEGVQSFSMSEKFGENNVLMFRILEVADGKVVLCPADGSQIFQLALNKYTGFDYGRNVINSICNLYDTNYSDFTGAITYEQMSAHVETDELNTFFANYKTWTTKGWYRQFDSNDLPIYGKYANINGSYNVELVDDSDSNGSSTYYVIPTITLNKNVTFLGKGTKNNPYTINLQQVENNYTNVLVGSHILYPLDLERSYDITKDLSSETNTTLTLSDKFLTSEAEFRVIDVSENGIVIAPGNSEELFSISLRGCKGFNNGQEIIERICNLYSSEYSNTTQNMSIYQLQALAETDMASIYNETYWDSANWGGDWDARSMTLTSSYAVDMQSSGSEYTRTFKLIPTVTINRDAVLYGAGTKEDPYRFYEESIYDKVSIGDYVLYPLTLENSTKGQYDSSIFNLSDKYTESKQIFRVVSKTSDRITISPDSNDELFILPLYNKTGYQDGVKHINSICNLYASEYSDVTNCMTVPQLHSLNSTALGSVYTGTYWDASNWNTEYNGRIMTTTSSQNLTFYASSTAYEGKHKVLPTVTLKPTVQLHGAGTADDPYIVSFEPVQYTISYDANGGNNAPESQSITHGEIITIGNEIPTRENYVFLGWSTNQTSIIGEYGVGSKYKVKENTTLYAIWRSAVEATDLKVGDYIYYPIDATKSYSTEYTGCEKQSFYMNKLFDENYVVFRILEISDGNIVLCPNDDSQIFSLKLGPEYSNGATYGKNIITSICALYSSDLSASTTCITYNQMKKHLETDELNVFFTEFAWILEGWGGVYCAHANSTVSETQPFEWTYGGGLPASGSYTNNVIPAITLNNDLKYYGAGTKDEPYFIVNPN